MDPIFIGPMFRGPVVRDPFLWVLCMFRDSTVWLGVLRLWVQCLGVLYLGGQTCF